MKIMVLRNKKRGISLIELVVALTLISLILMLVGPFFISNYKSLNKVSNQVDFQREAKSIMNYFTDSAMEASNISSINIDNNKESIDLSVNSTTKGLGSGDISITFDNDETNDSIKTTFKLENEVLYYKKNNNREIEIGQFVKNISFSALPSGSNFKNASSIEIRIEFDMNNADSYEVSNILTFRNKN